LYHINEMTVSAKQAAKSYNLPKIYWFLREEIISVLKHSRFAWICWVNVKLDYQK